MDISKLYSDKNLQDAIINSVGPCIINAGPGSGKTRFLCNKVAYLLLEKHIAPQNILVCTFTEKAAEELVKRIKKQILSDNIQSYHSLDFDKLRVGTIHSVFQKLIEDNIVYTPYKAGIKILDEFDRQVFIHKHLREFDFETYRIPANNGKTKTFFDFDDTIDIFYSEVDEWTLVDFLCEFFDAIVDQGVEIYGIDKLREKFKGQDSFIKIIDAYAKYKQLLKQYNYLDFAQIQNLYWNLLQEADARAKIRSEIKYCLVDEYQDTNYIQERAILESLGETNQLTDIENGERYDSRNIVVVGDINQSLYRFRGAEIDNILNFKRRFAEDVREYQLFSNYRSTKSIINLSNEFIRPNLEYYRKIHLDPNKFIIVPGKEKCDYPVLSFASEDRTMIGFVKDIHSFIENLLSSGKAKCQNDVAILLPSIKYTEARAFIEIFGDKIQLPQHINFFENSIIKKILISFCQVFRVLDVNEFICPEFNVYFNDEIKGRRVLSRKTIAELRTGDSLVEFLYALLGTSEIKGFFVEENFRAIGILSSLMQRFNDMYANDIRMFIMEYLPYIFKHSEDIFNDDIDAGIDKIRLMTIHQSKGLEFPIVIVGYNKVITNRTDVPRYKDAKAIIAGSIPKNRIEAEVDAAALELRRLYYVAFSRAKDLLIVGVRNANRTKDLLPNKFDYSICEKEHAQVLRDFSYESIIDEPEKPKFNFTGDIETYNLCPQMYAFIVEHGFVIPEKDDFSFGKLVHSTIENINKYILVNSLSPDDNELYEIMNAEFEKVFSTLDVSEKLLDQKQFAISQVQNYMNYFKPLLNKEYLHSVEEGVSYETSDYIIKGRIDAVFHVKDKFIIVDVKSGKKSNKSDWEIQNFESQIKLYSAIYKQKYSAPIGTMIYSTGEKDYRDGEYIVSNDGRTEEVIKRINDVILKIINKDYAIIDIKRINEKVCPQCPFKTFCKYNIIR